MDPRLLDYYSRELRYTTAMALEFARNHPKIARRLGMQAEEIGDPYVERLIQAFALLTAHMEMRIDSEYPELMQPLLEMIYPNYVCPTPAMAVACLRPGHESGHEGKGFLLPRGTSFLARTPVGKGTICKFRSSQDVVLYPLSIVMAQLTGAPPDIPSLESYVNPGVRVRSALRLRFRTTNKVSISALADMDKLPIYLTGDERTASHLYELIHSSAVATVMGKPGEFAKRPLYVVRQNAVVHEGLEPGQSLLPRVPDHLHGHNLLQEYFACPQRFWFFSLTNLAKGLAGIEGEEVEIVILLSRPAESYAERIDASCFALFCTPLINLFPMRTRRLRLHPGLSRHLIIPDLAAPLEYEIR